MWLPGRVWALALAHRSASASTRSICSMGGRPFFRERPYGGGLHAARARLPGCQQTAGADVSTRAATTRGARSGSFLLFFKKL